MNLPIEAARIIRRFAQAFPPPQGDPGEAHEDRCRVWVRALAEQLASSHSPRWGSKRAGSTRPQTKDLVAYQDGSLFVGFDILSGAGTGYPVLKVPDVSLDLTGQVFIPVVPKNRFAAISRAPLSGNWRGLSSFDLAARVAKSDRRWLTHPKTQYCSVWRVMVSRQSGPTPRPLAEGRQQMENLFPQLPAGIRLNVVLLCDTKDYTRQEMLDHVEQCNLFLVRYASSVALVELGNEIGHPTQSPDLMDIDFLEQLASRIDARFPLAWGGEFEGGSVVTLHTDRSLSPAENGAILATRQEDAGKPVIDDEPLGIAEVGQTAGRQRTSDPAYAIALVKASQANGDYPVTLHMDAGLTANVDELGPIQLAALDLFSDAYGPIVIPPTPNMDPLLDAILTPAYPTGYTFFINNGDAILERMAKEYEERTGRIPARTDVYHFLWRALNEGDRWKTLRGALEGLA